MNPKPGSRSPKARVRNRDRTGFSLIELLAAVAILIIVAALLLPGAGMLRDLRERKKAKVQMGMLINAAQAFRSEYNRWPCQTRDDIDVTYSNCAPVIGALTTNVSENPRGIPFLEIPEHDLRNDGAFVDPWHSSYIISVDCDGDGHVDVGLPGVGQIRGRTVVALSLGPDPENPAKRVCSWEE